MDRDLLSHLPVIVAVARHGSFAAAAAELGMSPSAVSHAVSDIVGEGFDAGIRLGEMIAEDMVAVRLTPPLQAIIVASSAYIGRHGRPKSLADLARHNCIGYRQMRSGALYRWDLSNEGKDVVVETRGTAIVTDSLSARDLALTGIGLVYLFEPLVRADIEAGRLVQVLPEASIEEPGLFLYFPRRASMAPKLRAFIDTARAVAAASG